MSSVMVDDDIALVGLGELSHLTHSGDLPYSLLKQCLKIFGFRSVDTKTDGTPTLIHVIRNH